MLLPRGDEGFGNRGSMYNYSFASGERVGTGTYCNLGASTSPLYTILVSNDITAAMMDGPGGAALTNESIEEAVAFRQTVSRVHRELEKKGEWFIRPWNADQVTEKKNGRKVAFADASPEFLVHEPDPWVLHPGETWHGFSDLEDGYCMLDPIKCRS